jgi:hypothetical protein
VEIPAEIDGKPVTEIRYEAFEACSGLHSALFLDDAPRTAGRDTFTNTAPAFTIFYLGDSSGLTSPTWNDYPAVRIDEQARPAAAWLVGHNLPYDTDLHQDLNGDGVNRRRREPAHGLRARPRPEPEPARQPATPGSRRRQPEHLLPRRQQGHHLHRADKHRP